MQPLSNKREYRQTQSEWDHRFHKYTSVYNTQWFQHCSLDIIYYNIFRITWIYVRLSVSLYALLVLIADVWYNFHVKMRFFSTQSDKITCLTYSPLLIYLGMRATIPWYNSKKDLWNLWSHSDWVCLYSLLFYRGCMFCVYLSTLLSISSGSETA